MNPKVLMKAARPGRDVRRGLRGAVAGVLAAASLLLAACGDGSAIEPFEPNRLFAFGDESSVLTADGRKYAVNALDIDGNIDCYSDPVWVQSLARSFNMVFEQCNPNGVAAPQARMRATANAKVADLVAAVESYLDTDVPAGKDLVTMFVGVNDVLEMYRRLDPPAALTEGQAVAELRARAQTLGRMVNRVALAGPAVILVTVPDLALSPYALIEKAAHPDETGSAARNKVLGRLVDEFNSALRLEIINDGRLIGLLNAQNVVQTMVSDSSNYGLSNVTRAVCLNVTAPPGTDPAPLLDCTEAPADLVSGAVASRYLWADNLRLGAQGHLQLAQVAISLAQKNPF